MTEFGPEALVFDVRGVPTFAPLPGEPIDEYGRPVPLIRLDETDEERR